MADGQAVVAELELGSRFWSVTPWVAGQLCTTGHEPCHALVCLDGPASLQYADTQRSVSNRTTMPRPHTLPMCQPIWMPSGLDHSGLMKRTTNARGQLWNLPIVNDQARQRPPIIRTPLSPKNVGRLSLFAGLRATFRRVVPASLTDLRTRAQRWTTALRSHKVASTKTGQLVRCRLIT